MNKISKALNNVKDSICPDGNIFEHTKEFKIIEKESELLEILKEKSPVIKLVKNTKNVYEYNKETYGNSLTEKEYEFIKKNS